MSVLVRVLRVVQSSVCIRDKMNNPIEDATWKTDKSIEIYVDKRVEDGKEVVWWACNIDDNDTSVQTPTTSEAEDAITFANAAMETFAYIAAKRGFVVPKMFNPPLNFGVELKITTELREKGNFQFWFTDFNRINEITDVQCWSVLTLLAAFVQEVRRLYTLN